MWVRCSPSKLFYYTEPKLTRLTRWLNRLSTRQRDPTMLAKIRLEEFAMRLQRDNPLPPIHYQVSSRLCYLHAAYRALCELSKSPRWPKSGWRSLRCACSVTIRCLPSTTR